MIFKINKILTIAWIIIPLYFFSSARAQIGSTGMNILNLTPNPRSLSLGEATSAGVKDASTVYWNPAGLTVLASPEFSANYRPLFVDTHLINVQGVLPLPGLALGFDLSYMSFGDIPLYEGGIQTQTASPYQLRLGVSSSLAIVKWFHLGLQASWLRQELTASTVGDGFSFDIGILIYRPWSYIALLSQLDMSLVIQHIGLAPQYFDKAPPLPTTVTVGWAYGLPFVREGEEISQINFSLDIGWVDAVGFKAGLGVEWILPQIDVWEIALRAGYKLPENEESLFGLGGGFGLKWQSIQINYSFASEGEFGFGHIVGVNYTFVKLPKVAENEQ